MPCLCNRLPGHAMDRYTYLVIPSSYDRPGQRRRRSTHPTSFACARGRRRRGCLQDRRRRRRERSNRRACRANLGNTNITHATIESGAITAVAVMNEETSRYSLPSAAFDNLLRRPRSGRMRRHANVDDLSAGMIDHEEHVKHSERDRSDTEEVARPDLRPVLPQE